MIDTVTIRYTMTSAEAALLIEKMTIRVPETDKQIHTFLNPHNTTVWSLRSYRKEDTMSISPGLIMMRFYKHGYCYYLELSLHLEALVENKKTTRLFVSTPGNIEILQDAYADMIQRLFPDIGDYVVRFSFDSDICDFVASGTSEAGIARLPYLALCVVLRVDYTVNLAVDDKNMYLYLLNKSFLETDRFYLLDNKDNDNVAATTQTVKYDVGELVPDKNTGKLKPKTIKSRSPFTKINFYDKARKYRDTGNVGKELITEAENIVRFEVSYHRVHHWPKDRQKRKLQVKEAGMCGLLPWLDEEVAMESLSSIYYRHIGNATFVKKYTYNKTIAAADFSYTSKEAERKFKAKLIDIAELISRAHSVRLAKEQFVAGTTIGKPARTIKGTASEFNSLLESIISTGVMPLRLPEYGATKLISRFENPFRQYEEGTPALVGYEFVRENPFTGYAIDTSSFSKVMAYIANNSTFSQLNEDNKGIA